MNEEQLTDLDWLTNSFMVSPKIIRQPSLLKRVANSARFKCVDTTPGGNVYHNPPPQWCRFTDPKEPGFGGSKGVGIAWSEMMDDTASLIHMRPGITAYNSMTRFFTKGLSQEMNYMAKTGEAPGLIFRGFEGIGTITTIPFLPLTWFGQAVDFAMNKPQTKYAYLRHTPALYFSAASNIFNTLTAYSGVSASSTVENQGEPLVKPVDEKQRALFSLMLPDVINERGEMDLFAIATRARKLTAARAAYMESQLKSATSAKDFYKATLGVDDNGDPVTPPPLSGAHQNLSGMLKAWASGPGQMRQGAIDPISGKTIETKPVGYWDELSASFMARFHNGLDWVSFKYDGEKTVSYGTNNTLGESQLSSTLKSVVGAANNAVFSFAGGNLGDNVVMDTIESGVGLVADAVNGFLSGLGAGGLISVGGAAYTDLPEQWMESSADLPGFNLSLELRAWSGHPLNIAKRIHLPMALLLPFMLPRSVGHSTYTSPFAMEYFAKGHSQSRYSMCVGGTIELGDEQGGWTVGGLARVVKMNLEIKDMSTVMHMPIGTDYSVKDGIDSLFADDTALNNFLAAVGGLGYEAQNSTSRFKVYNMRKYLASRKIDDFFSPSRHGMLLAESTPGRVVTAAYHAFVNL